MLGLTTYNNGFIDLNTFESQPEEDAYVFLPELSKTIDDKDFFCSTPEVANSGIKPTGNPVGSMLDLVGKEYTGSMSTGAIDSPKDENIGGNAVRLPTRNIPPSPIKGVNPYTPFVDMNLANPVTFCSTEPPSHRCTGVYTYGRLVPGMKTGA